MLKAKSEDLRQFFGFDHTVRILDIALDLPVYRGVLLLGSYSIPNLHLQTKVIAWIVALEVSRTSITQRN